MDGNKDESGRCISLAKRCILDNDNSKALKFLYKAERLFPSKEAKDLIEKLESLKSNDKTSDDVDEEQNTFDSQSNDDNLRFRSHHRSNSSPNENEIPTSNGSASTSSSKEFTKEQVKAVKEVRKCKDYYEILGVTKEATEIEIKKQYRKLALQFHPDKNKAPGASEAFKAIGNAFAVLNDPEKRKQYDLYGTEEDQRRASSYDNGYYDYTRGFESDISADEIFNMFFGGGFPGGNVYIRRGNRWREAHVHRQNAQNQETASGYSVLLQMMPVLILLILSLMSTIFVSDPPYSLSKTQKYIYERKTHNLEVPFFVKEHFERDYKGSIKRIESQVEDDYVSTLRTSCFRERNYKESMIWRARNFRDRDMEERAKQMKTPSCDTLQRLSASSYVIW